MTNFIKNTIGAAFVELTVFAVVMLGALAAGITLYKTWSKIDRATQWHEAVASSSIPGANKFQSNASIVPLGDVPLASVLDKLKNEIEFETNKVIDFCITHLPITESGIDFTNVNFIGSPDNSACSIVDNLDSTTLKDSTGNISIQALVTKRIANIEPSPTSVILYFMVPDSTFIEHWAIQLPGLVVEDAFLHTPPMDIFFPADLTDAFEDNGGYY